jgi:hypothetical protein
MSDRTENLEFENWVINYNIEKITQFLDYNFNTLSVKNIKIILKHDEQLLKELIDNNKYKPNKFTVIAYKDKLTLEDLKYFIVNGLVICDSVITIICSNNKVDCFEYLINNYRQVFNLNTTQLTNIFVWGFIDIIRLALNNLDIELEVIQPIISLLIRKGKLKILKIIKEQYHNEEDGFKFFITTDLELSIEYGCIELFRYIYDNCDLFMTNVINYINELTEKSIKFGKERIFKWIIEQFNEENLTDNEKKIIERHEYNNIELAIQYNRIDFAKLLINKYIAKYNVFPNIKISVILGNNNIELLNLYLENNKLNYGIKHYIMEWIELNNIQFEMSDLLYQKVIKNYPNISESFHYINEILEYKKINIIDIKDLLKDNTVISDDIIDNLISDYLWNY